MDQLHKYEFSSVSPRSISISNETYKPIHEDGFDLGFDLSATDMIRLIWSYLVGLLELTRSQRMDHPGFLIFDEPRQHEMAPSSYAEFLGARQPHAITISRSSSPLADRRRASKGYLAMFRSGLSDFQGRS